MRLTLAQIETFYWIARLGSFHAAARHLNLTQPSVSGRIRELERQLGVQLLERVPGGRTRSTTAGHAFHVQAEAMLSLAHDMEHRAVTDGLQGLLRLGVVETVAHLALPGLIAALKLQRSGLRIELAVDIGAVLMGQLADRLLDVVITTETSAVEGAMVRPLGRIDLAWVGPRSHPHVGDIVMPADLVDQPIFTQPPDSVIGRTIGTWFEAGGQAPRSLNICNSLSVIGELVAAGLGFAVITPALLRGDLASQVRRFRAQPPISARMLSVATLGEGRSEDVDFIAGFVADALRAKDALV